MSDEKTEQPTPHKIKKAREEGQVAKSRDFTQTLLVGALFGYTVAYGADIANAFAAIWTLAGSLHGNDFRGALSILFPRALETLILQTLPYLLIVIVVGICGEMAQTGMLFAPKALKPKGDKIDPVKNLKQMFSMKSLMEFIKNILKVVFLSILVWLVIRDYLNDMTKIPAVGIFGAGAAMAGMLKTLTIYTFIGFGAIALADLIWQRKQHIKQLMMSMDEIKREYKEQEGNPEMKGHRKEIAQDIVFGEDPAPAKTRNATAVVTNPTHLAIAIQYLQDSMPLPVVIAKGADGVAKRMIAVARANNIPVLENVPLARGLWSRADLDQYIPSEFVEPVAGVLLEIRRMAAERQAWNSPH